MPIFSAYEFDSRFYDEIFTKDKQVREVYQTLFKLFSEYSVSDFVSLNDKAKDAFFNQGITFQVYNDKETKEKIFPFDLFPRIIGNEEWLKLEAGALQRSKALNLFLWDLYHDQKIIKQGVVPMDLISSSASYLEQMKGFNPPGGVYNHVSGTDLIKHSDGEYYVLEDNIRCPSGVSYVVGNREALKRTLFGVFNHYTSHNVSDYGQNLLEIIESVKPKGVDVPKCVVLNIIV